MLRIIGPGLSHQTDRAADTDNTQKVDMTHLLRLRDCALLAAALYAMSLTACLDDQPSQAAADTAADVGDDTAEEDTTDSTEADTAVADTAVADTTEADADDDTQAMDVDDASEEVIDDTVEPDPTANCTGKLADTIEFTTETGFGDGEDFTIAPNGDYYSFEQEDLIVRRAGETQLRLILPNLGQTAGMSLLPDGDLVIASVDNGSLLRVSVVDKPGAPAGSVSTILSGLEYPNGLDIDADGTIFVAEQDGQRLRSVNPDTGDFTILATDLCNANGVSFGVGYERVYVGSFGCGLIYWLDREADGSWSAPSALGRNGLIDQTDPGDPDPVEPELNWCLNMAVGAACGTESIPSGTCEDTGEPTLTCVADNGPPVLVAACEAKSNGDGCLVTAGGSDYPGFCENLFGEFQCNIDDDPTCDGKGIAEPCTKLTYGYLYTGQCLPTFSGLRCNGEPGGGGGGGWGVDPHPESIGTGQLDGLNVDACGNIYVTEFVEGLIWRIDADHGPAVAVTNLPSNWIPNLHWGVGTAGWEPTTLYVSDRDQGRMFALDVGFFGKETTAPTTPAVTP